MTRRTSGGLKAGDYRALAEFRRALRQFLAFSETEAADAGLTPAQHQALLAIKGMPGSGPVSVGELAAWLGVRHNSCVGLVDRLADAALVTRRADPSDRRRIYVRLTALAERKLAGLSAAHRDELRRLSASLGPLLAGLG